MTLAFEHVLNFAEGDFTESNALEELLNKVKQQQGCPTKVDLRAAKFASTSDFSRLLQTLAENTSLIELSLSHYLCSDDYFSNDGSLGRLLQGNASLQTLDLSGNSIDHNVAADLAQGLQHNSTLTELKLHCCSLDDTSAGLLLESALVNDSLRSLDLGANNHLTPSFLNKSLVSYLDKSQSIQSLTLAHSSSLFGERTATSVKPFVQAVERNQGLQSLCMRHCRLNEDIGKTLLEALTVNTSLVSLDLEFSRFGLRDRGNEILIQVLPRLSTLQTLKLYTKYSTAQVPKLLRALAQNQSLRSFQPRMDTAQQQRQVQVLLTRNVKLAQVQSLLQVSSTAAPHDDQEAKTTTAAVLPAAIAQLTQTTPAGSAASFEVLSHWIADCL